MLWFRKFPIRVIKFIFVLKFTVMKIIAMMLIAMISLTACKYTTGSGNIVTEKRVTGNFDGIVVEGGFEVTLKNGPVTEVVVESDDNILKYIETVVQGGVLKIRIKHLHSFGDVHLRVMIISPVINSVVANAGSDVKGTGELRSDAKMSFKASSGSSISFSIDAPETDVELGSGSTIELRGRTKDYTAQVGSGAELKSGKLLSENATVSVSSGGSANVHASVTLKARASSGGSIKYHGGAALDRSESSGGQVEQGE